MGYKEILKEKIKNNSAVIGIIGLGYVGLPLALTFCEKGFNVIGFDIDKKKIPILMDGNTYIKHITADRIKKVIDDKKFIATFDFPTLTKCDCVIIAVPTPLDKHRQPDMSYVENSAKIAAENFRKGQLIILESSTYPGTTEEILLPMFENASSGNYDENIYSEKLTVGKDFFLAFSPEREDPNNPDYCTETIPKVVGGVTPNCLKLACSLYDQIIVKTVPVSSPGTAEATKLLENIYRSVNIALVNELKMVFGKMGIDIWEVIEAAKTKPFGFHAFYPGPGLGGHCIPIDPFYLTWKAHEYDMSTKFIELAGEINTQQPYYVIQKSIDALNENGKSIKNAKVLVLGVSYKKNIDDMRESPSLKLIEIFNSKGAIVEYSDPYVFKLTSMRKYHFNMESKVLSAENLKSYDLVVLSTDHDNFDYAFIAKNASLIIDTRNAFAARKISPSHIYKA